MSFCVGADDSLPENILGVKTALAGGLAAAPTSNCVTPTQFANKVLKAIFGNAILACLSNPKPDDSFAEAVKLIVSNCIRVIGDVLDRLLPARNSRKSK